MPSLRDCVKLFVARVSFPFSELKVDYKPGSIGEWREAIEFAVNQKITPLFVEGVRGRGLRLPGEEAEELLEQWYSRYRARWAARLSVISELVELSEAYGINVIVFKTLKPFAHDPDDVDVLVRKGQADLLVDALRRRGFALLKKGTPEVSLRKLYPNTYVDVDVHTRLAVGFVEVFGGDVFRYGVTYKWVDTGDGKVKVPVLADELEVLREAAYVLLKDMVVDLRSLYLGAYALLKMNVERLLKLAEIHSLESLLSIYLTVISRILESVLSVEDAPAFRDGARIQGGGILKLIASTLRPHGVPYAPNPLIVAYSYYSKLFQDITRYKDFSTLRQVLKQPGARGIGLLLDYIENLVVKRV